MNLKNQTILITGGTSGIGKALSLELLKRGNKIIITGRREELLEEIQGENPEIIIFKNDLSSEQGRVELFEFIKEKHPELSILVNNAGVQLASNFNDNFNLENARRELETNVIAPIHLASLLVTILEKNSESAIINISSGLAFTPIAFLGMYCASKAAIHSLSLSLRHQLRNTSIKVFEIAPPAVDTELGHEMRTPENISHGGIPVQEFVDGAMYAIENNILEHAVGMSVNLREKREAMFDALNSRF